MKNLKKTKQLGIMLCSFVLLLIVALASCKKNRNDDAVNNKPELQSKLTEAEETRIIKAGFSAVDAVKVGASYLVEGDILLSAEDLNHQTKLIEGLQEKNGPSTEQYKSAFRLADKYIKNGQIKIKVDAGKLQKFVTDATTIAIKRYNDLKLGATFVLETSLTGTADIVVKMQDLKGDLTGQAAGFPTADGNPAPSLSLNSNRYTNATEYTAEAISTVLAHEIGHCIGFRHTDYIDLGSCAGGIGESTTISTRDANGNSILDANGKKIPNLTTTASLIPGTAKYDPDSWMGACNQAYSFTSNDKIALYYLLGKQ